MDASKNQQRIHLGKQAVKKVISQAVTLQVIKRPPLGKILDGWKSEPPASFKLFSELFFGCLPVHWTDFPEFEVGFGLSECFAVPRRTLNERLLGSKIGPKRLHNLKFFPAWKLAQLGDAHGTRIYTLREQDQTI